MDLANGFTEHEHLKIVQCAASQRLKQFTSAARQLATARQAMAALFHARFLLGSVKG